MGRNYSRGRGLENMLPGAVVGAAALGLHGRTRRRKREAPDAAAPPPHHAGFEAVGGIGVSYHPQGTGAGVPFTRAARAA